MLYKKLITILMSIVLIVNTSLPVHGLEAGNASIDDVDHAMSVVANSLTTLSDTASSSDVKGLADIFNGFIDIARTTGTIVTAVNGSITFLRLIGILNDPTQTKLDSILEKLEVIDERLSSMDDKLNDLTTMMSELTASVEFNARTEKAILYEGSWRDFEYRYMEDSMDKLISQYSSMLRSGLMSWCNGSRNEGGIDNTKIIVTYKDGELTYSDSNSAPSNTSYVIIPSECLPSSFSYDVNSFNESLASEIASNINKVIESGETSSIETHDYSLEDADINALSKDAVNTLIYRVASSKVNSDSSFAGEVKRQFANYCAHLTSSGDGVDAVLKTYFLTHAFEYSIAQDIKDYMDRMIITTGTYGMFTSTVLGMSHLIADDEKISAVNQMTSAIKVMEDGKKNAITGKGNYCYVTGTNLYYSTISFDSSGEIYAHYTMSNTTYQSSKGHGPEVYIQGVTSKTTSIGDVGLIVLVNTLLSNGVSLTHDYLNEHIGIGSNENYGKIVTGYSSAQTLSIDGKTKLHVKNTFGDYFKNDSTITNLPGDAELEYVTYRKKISGSLYDTSSRALSSNATLAAIALYGENHALWFTDEGGFMGGPADAKSFFDNYSVEKTGSDSTGVIRTHSYHTYVDYNYLLSEESDAKYGNGVYNPLMSLEEDIAPIEFNQNDYEQVEGMLLGASNNSNEESILIVAPDYEEPKEEIVEEIVEDVETLDTEVDNTLTIDKIVVLIICFIIICLLFKKKKEN